MIPGYYRRVVVMRRRLALRRIVVVNVREAVTQFDTWRSKSYRQRRERTKNMKPRKSRHSA
jgi:hypothetical protein